MVNNTIQTSYPDIGKAFATHFDSLVVTGGSVFLDALLEAGFQRHDLARMVHVSIPVISDWQRKGTMRNGDFAKLVSLVTMVDLLKKRGVDEPIKWFERPLHPGIKLNAIDLIDRGRQDLVLSLIEDDDNVYEVLDAYDSHWQTHLANSNR